ncbi:MAG: tetratricopeptide repeat protein [Alphaproteobacteria bacterium]
MIDRDEIRNHRKTTDTSLLFALRRMLCAAILLTSAAPVSAAVAAGTEVSPGEEMDFQEGLEEFRSDDHADAFAHWYPLAQEGIPEAQYNIGRMLALGEGIERDNLEAYAWFIRAAMNGRAEAFDAMQQLDDFLTEDEINLAKARAREIERIEIGYTGEEPLPPTLNDGSPSEPFAEWPGS